MKNEVTEVNNPEVATVARFAKTINYKNNTVNKQWFTKNMFLLNE